MSERYCILCVDDDVSRLEARAAVLEEEGYSVTAVSCPLRANLICCESLAPRWKRKDVMNPRSAFRAVYTENEIANDNPAHPDGFCCEV
jgi:CheY-like chemotaxis protein